VDFSWFSVLEDDPSDGEYKSYTPESDGGPSGSGGDHNKRPWKEVSDISWWGTCFFASSNGMGNEGAGNVRAIDGLQRSDREDGKMSVVPRGKIRLEIRTQAHT